MNNIAYNVMTGLFFVTGKGFVAKTPTEGTPISELDTPDMAEKWIGVAFVDACSIELADVAGAIEVDVENVNE